MIERIYTYRLSPPADPTKAIEGMRKMADLLAAHNKWITKCDMRVDGTEIILELTAQGHDQWWIKKRIIYPLVAVLTRGGMKVQHARLIAVERPTDKRSTRLRASDGRSNPPPEDAMIEHEELATQ